MLSLSTIIRFNIDNNLYDLISLEFTINNNNSLTGRSTLIFGGLLDRCIINHNSEIYEVNILLCLNSEILMEYRS